jgi:uncharacterized protein YqeY
MDLKSQIDKDFLEAYKAKDEAKVSVLRMLKSAIKNSEIAEKKTLTDEEILRVLKKEVKQRTDSVSEYTKAGRADLAEKEEKEINVIKNYLPAELSDEEISNIVEQAISETGASEIKDMGKVIALVMQKSQGAADGAKVANLVRTKLQK